MKKYIPIAIIMTLFLIISLLYTPVYYDKFLAKTKSVTTLIEIEHFIKDPEILIPSYGMDEKNPYTHVANQILSLERSDQYGEWDGYGIIISPSKLSNSSCFSISISCSKTDDNKSIDLSWTKNNATLDYISRENYPDGKYTRYIGAFQKGNYTYEITGYIYGPVDEGRDKEILEELMYLTDSLK